MLTRLRVTGFKNLEDVDVRFGPFTCIAGTNGVGKSNVFDAIAFLSSLAKYTLIDAARRVRADDKSGDVGSLFARVGAEIGSRMRLEADMIIPGEGTDELGQEARAGITLVRYSLELEYVPPSGQSTVAQLRVVSENLGHIKLSEARDALRFDYAAPWLKSVVMGRRSSPYISTDEEVSGAIVQLHMDSERGEGGGRPHPFTARTLPRTVLSSVNNAREHRTAVLVRKEMMGWTHLQLEPSALRAPDAFSVEPGIASNGAHMPATLYALMAHAGTEPDVCARVARRIAELVDRVDAITVEKDERRQLYELVLTDRNHTRHYARSLSDGTLRFLALAILEEDDSFRPLVCLEEPENGIHPSRIPAMIQLLRDVAVDANSPVGPDNRLRQVLVNTHSSLVVGEIDPNDLLVAQATEVVVGGRARATLRLSPLEDTWRARIEGAVPLPEGRLLEYLSPAGDDAHGDGKRVRNRPMVQRLLFGRDAAE